MNVDEEGAARRHVEGLAAAPATERQGAPAAAADDAGEHEGGERGEEAPGRGERRRRERALAARLERPRLGGEDGKVAPVALLNGRGGLSRLGHWGESTPSGGDRWQAPYSPSGFP